MKIVFLYNPSHPSGFYKRVSRSLAAERRTSSDSAKCGSYLEVHPPIFYCQNLGLRHSPRWATAKRRVQTTVVESHKSSYMAVLRTEKHGATHALWTVHCSHLSGVHLVGRRWTLPFSDGLAPFGFDAFGAQAVRSFFASGNR